LDWERKRVAIYFSDIEWFTSISEKMQAEELVAFLREFLSEMSDVILDEKWFINKYEWDAIMALWWVFIDDNKSSYYACSVSLKQQILLNELNKKWQNEWISKVKVRIGLHIWEAIVWNIGSQGRKMEFTALWDSVNLASRLEWVNKFYWTYICVSEDIYKENKWNFEFRYLDTIRVKWKDNPVKIYELLDLKWELKKEKRQIFKKFNEAIELYKARDFIQAKTIFEELIKLWDKPSEEYLRRCKIYIRKKPREDWDRIWDFEEK
jgi:adenylate cyclase